MINKKQYEEYRIKTLKILDEAGIQLTQEERNHIEIADFGLNRIEEIGLQVITYVNTNRCCAKELVLFPNQICPEHRHPSIDKGPGKEETFRCRRGKVYLYVGGYENNDGNVISTRVPEDLKKYFNVSHEIILYPGEQYTLSENTLHWFKAGEDGCIVSEFSTKSVDDLDIFTDPNIIRIPETIE